MTDHGDDPKDTWENWRRDADKGREPQLIPAQLGHRQVSFRALAEQVEQQFIEEHSDSPLLRDADTPSKRLRLLVGTTDYVLATGSVHMSAEDKAALIGAAYSNLFGYGPLDALLLDTHVTTISLEGADRAAVRYGHGELESVGPLFEDEVHLRRILRRMLVDAGADLYDDQPFIETGLKIDGRPVSITVITPLMSFSYSADIRVHPRKLPSMDSLIESGFVTNEAAQMLRTIVTSSHGFVVVGDAESGKTTLLSVLAQSLPNADQTIAVERAGELRLPEGGARLVTRWPSENQPGISFGEQIGLALAQQPRCILLDEVRADEPQTIAPLLQEAHAPRQIWSFRGPFDAKRLRNALSMLARRADMSQTEAMVEALYQRLPFVITVWRAHGKISLYSIAEWQYRSSDYPDYVLLMETRDGKLRLTSERPVHTLDLPETFWAG
jgi:Flp pilus assembly CpaF family ATPase